MDVRVCVFVASGNRRRPLEALRPLMGMPQIAEGRGDEAAARQSTSRAGCSREPRQWYTRCGSDSRHPMCSQRCHALPLRRRPRRTVARKAASGLVGTPRQLTNPTQCDRVRVSVCLYGDGRGTARACRSVSIIAELRNLRKEVSETCPQNVPRGPHLKLPAGRRTRVVDAEPPQPALIERSGHPCALDISLDIASDRCAFTSGAPHVRAFSRWSTSSQRR